MRSVEVSTFSPHPYLLHFPHCIRYRKVCILIHYCHIVSDLKWTAHQHQNVKSVWVKQEIADTQEKRVTFLPSSKFLSLKKSLFINIKQMKNCQILISLNIHTGLVPLKSKNMPQNMVEVGWALSPPQLMTAHDQANLQQTQRKKRTGAQKAFG